MKVFYKNRATDRIWWVDEMGMSGLSEISFDKKTVYNLFRDYPHNMTKEEVALFDKENPFWADYFRTRSVKNLAGPRIICAGAGSGASVIGKPTREKMLPGLLEKTA